MATMKIHPVGAPRAGEEDTTALVLIAEDNADLSLAMTMIFRRAGHQVLTAGDGQATLKLTRQRQPDLLVLDVSMPGTNGLDTCRALRGDPDTAAIAILMVSAWASPADVLAGHEAGADDYLVKPFRNDQLLSRADAMLSRMQVPRRPP
jgi:DNA-binding response OmpR family regulator